MSRVTGKCPICGAATVDGNTYDGIHCQREGEARQIIEDEDDLRRSEVIDELDAKEGR